MSDQANPSAAPAPAPASPGPSADAVRNWEKAGPERYADMQDDLARGRGEAPAERIGSRKLNDAEYDRLTPGEKLTYAERQTEAAAKAKAGTDPAAPDRPDDGKAKIKVGDYELTPAELQGLIEHKGRMDSRAANVPPTPDGYQPRLPKDFQPPQGIEYAVDPNHPLMGMAKQLMHDIDSGKVSGQAAFERMLSLHAANEVGTLQFMQTARDGEIAKLGAAGPQRVQAIETWLRGHLGDELAGPVSTMLVSEKIVRGFERIMNGGGLPSYRPPRDMPDDSGKLSEEAYNKLSFAEKIAYANRFPQQDGGGR